MPKPLTIHTARTIMSAELIEVMNFAEDGRSYQELMDDNVFNKKTETSKKYTIGFLTRLYTFDSENYKFLSLENYWKKIEENEKALLALIYSTSVDYLIKESIDFVKSVKIGDRASIEGFESNVEHYHKNRFSPKTLRSVSQNIASSWKQAGYVLGKRKNIRTLSKPSYHIVAFAFLMAYIDGERGDYLFEHPAVKALDATNEEVHSLIKDAADRGLLSYNRSGASIVISFDNYLKSLANV